MNLRKIISIILIFILILMQVGPIVYAENDVLPPSIISISSSNARIKAGETVTFNMEIEDDFSGPSTIFIQWTLKSDNTKSISKQFYNISNVNNFNYIVPENTYPGEWQAAYISLSDYADNCRFYYRDYENEELLSKLDFEVESTDQDTVAPVVSNVRIITQDISAPGEVLIQYDVTDDKSGVKQNSGGVSFSKFKDSSDTHTFSSKKIAENTYQSIIGLESKYERLFFSHIQVSDNAGNWKNYYREDLGITTELDLIPSNYEEDTTAPRLTSIEYNKTKLNIPDLLEITINAEDDESGILARGLACFKCEDESIKGNKYIASDYKSYTVVDNPELAEYYSPEPYNPYLFIGSISSATDSEGRVLDNKLRARLDFNDSEEFRGNIYLDKLIVWDKAGNKSIYSIENNTIEKETITISKVEKEYTLETSSAKSNYIDEISKLPEGSTVLCNVVISNQIIEKELFDTIKGRDITITFMSIYNGSSNITGTNGTITSSDTNMGIQWIINGKDIVNETKDVNMEMKFSRKTYSKYIVPEYEFDENLENDYWSNADWDNSSEEELLDGIHKLQKVEIEKYFSYLKEQGYLNTEEYLQKTLAELEYADATVKDIIIHANDYTKYLCIEFEDNGLLPSEALIRIKPDYATRALFGASDLNLYFANNDDYSLLEKDISVDEENYYNFRVTHNSEYWLTNGIIEKLAKNNTVLKGDINRDGKITLYDAFSMLRLVILGSDISSEEVQIMDFNNDNEVTLYDAFSFLRIVILE